MNYLARVSPERLKSISENTGLSVAKIKELVLENELILSMIAQGIGKDEIIDEVTILLLADPHAQIELLENYFPVLMGILTSYEETVERIDDNYKNAYVVHALCSEALTKDMYYFGRKKCEAIDHYRKTKRDKQNN